MYFVIGGGSYKYCKLIQEKLGLTPEKEDEVACLIKGKFCHLDLLKCSITYYSD